MAFKQLKVNKYKYISNTIGCVRLEREEIYKKK